ncbi:unnamed protein product, partial [Durusdinium trenchii]
MFVSAGVEASIDNIYGSSNMEIPSAYLSVGTFVSCMLFVGTETVRCWGAGSFGILGQGSTQNIGDDPDEMGDNLKPIDLGTGRTVKQVACGSAHVCALLDNEVLKCWGYGLEGRLGQGNTKSIGDGPNEMGDNLAPIDLGINRTAKTVAAGEHHTCAILDNDSLKCWGSGSFGKLGQGSTKDIGDDPDEMGDNLEPIDLGTGRTVKQVSLGRDFTCALLDDDSLKCWGYGGNGNLGQGSTEHIGDEPNEMGDNLAPIDLGPNRKVKHVVAGGLHTCVLLHDETVLCWGFARHGQLGRCCAENIGDSEHEMGYSLTAVDLGSMRTAKQITAGYMHTCALLDDHSVKCWGHGVYGQLGQGDNSHLGDDADEMGDLLEPIDFGEDRKARQLASASGYDFHSCVLLDDDSVKCWGWGNAGVLGQGSTDSIGDAMAEMGDFLHPINFGALSTVAQIDIRLFGGSSMRGRLQVLHRDSWRDVCDDNWHGADAQVVCQQLGLAGGVATWRLVGSGQFWMDDVTCVGTEANLGPYPSPSAREGHTAVFDSLKRHMYVLGGFNASYKNDMWRYKAPDFQEVPMRECSLGQECSMEFADVQGTQSCDLGSHCLVYGLQGTRLTKDDKLLAMKECGTSPATSAFVDPQPVHGSYSGLGNVTFDFGLLPLEGFASETVQLCWCSAGSTCSDPEDFRTPAMQLDDEALPCVSSGLFLPRWGLFHGTAQAVPLWQHFKQELELSASLR